MSKIRESYRRIVEVGRGAWTGLIGTGSGRFFECVSKSHRSIKSGEFIDRLRNC